MEIIPIFNVSANTINNLQKQATGVTDPDNIFINKIVHPASVELETSAAIVKSSWSTTPFDVQCLSDIVSGDTNFSIAANTLYFIVGTNIKPYKISINYGGADDDHDISVEEINGCFYARHNRSYKAPVGSIVRRFRVYITEDLYIDSDLFKFRQYSEESTAKLALTSLSDTTEYYE